ncbi:MAG: AprI/Inh family metalloprotease inhibitor [Pseudomonadota bacterium]
MGVLENDIVASTRGCGEVTLSQIGAWNVEGNNVVLKDTNGAPLATLARTGDSSFSGATSGGGGISMSR